MPGDIHSYLSDMLGAARSKSGDELLIYSVEQVLAAAGPKQAEVLRRCAVPRWIDAGVLRVLRESEGGNERVMDKLREYSFVRELGDGRMAYHDQVRQALLDEWRRDRPDDLRHLHRRLYSYFSNRTTPPGSDRRAMPLMPDSSLLSVVPMSVEADLLSREALYHLMMVDMDRGLEALRESFNYLDDHHRLADAELLLQTAGETPLGPRERRWVQYMRARTLQAALRLDEAAAQLSALRERGDLEPDLAAEVSRSLGEVYSEIGQWAQATELYRQSLAHFARSNNQRAVAETMLLLGEAYQGLGVSTGSWHAPTMPANPALQALYVVWVWLLGLPFQVAGLLLGPGNRLLPRPEHCARYQNWLLIRLYNTARIWYAQARDAFGRLGDPAGILRADQRLADILLLYGYHEEARAALEEMLRRPAARDPYRKAWLQRSLAECHLAGGDVGSAQLLLAEALEVFEDLGDVRREATVRYLQGRAAMQAGDVEGALRNYGASLGYFRARRYDAARERILHELRAWERRPGVSPATRERIGAMVAAEPEKRYVGRFIRSYQGLLQISTMLALPAAMLLMAIVAPGDVLAPGAGGVISINLSFNLWRVLGVAATLIPLYLAIYAAIATSVIYWLPINRIEREQPDIVITRPGGIARYDRRGKLAMELAWRDVARWIALDRCLWARPLTLYSRTYLEDAAGRDLPIDGITGWYGELQKDIGQRLRAAGSAVARRDLGYSILRSAPGISAGVGLLLLLIVTSSANGWLNLGGLFPPPLAGLLWYVALSGVLILAPLAHWLANRPLQVQRTLQLNERWPAALAAIGALPVLAFLLSGGKALPVDALNHTTFVWGAYVLAEALMAIWAPGRRWARVAVVCAATLLALAYVATPALAHYRWLEGYVARRQVGVGVLAAAPSCQAASEARDLGAEAYTTYLIQGDCAAAAGSWPEAARYYADAAGAAPRGSGEQVLAYYNLALAARYAGDRQAAAAAAAEVQLICAASPPAQPICRQIFPQSTR